MRAAKMLAYRVWEEYCRTTDAHGWYRVMYPQHSPLLRRLFWLLCCLASTTLLVYFSQQRIAQYFRYGVQTKFEQHTASNLPMPAVTICNKNEVSLNKLTSEHVRAFFAGVKVADVEGSLNPGSEKTVNLIKTFIGRESTTNTTRVRNSNQNRTFDYVNFVKEFGYTYDDMISSCKLDGRPCKEIENLYINNEVIVFPYGKCITINDNIGDQDQLLTSPRGGLLLHVLVDMHNFNHVRVEKLYRKHGYDAMSTLLPNTRPSLLLQVHDSRVAPDFIAAQWVPVYGGERVDVAIDKMVEVRRLYPPYQECSNNPDYGGCLRACMRGVMLSAPPRCLLYDAPSPPHTDQRDYCHSLPYPGDKVIRQLLGAFSGCIEGNSCVPPCKEVTYNYRVTNDLVDLPEGVNKSCKDPYHLYDYSQYEEEEEEEGGRQEVEEEEEVRGREVEGSGSGGACAINHVSADNQAFVSVKFSRSLMERIRYEEEFSFDSLVAEVGGMMGLFLGMSTLTLVHMVEIILHSCIVHFRKHGHHKPASAGEEESRRHKRLLHLQSQQLYY